MSAAVKASARNLPALAVSLALHASLVLFPFVSGLIGKVPAPVQLDPRESIAFQGTSTEIDAPTSEVGAAVAEQEVAIDAPEPATEPEREPAAVTTPEQLEAEPAPPPRPTPRPRPSARPRVAPPAPTPSASPAAAATAVAASPGADSPSGTSAPGSFGAEGLPPGVRRLGYGFSRAIPAATPGDAAWQELPPGLVGTIRIEITLGEDNRVEGLQVLPPRRGEPPIHPALERMAQRTLLQLKIGQFALSGSNQPGKERLEIEVRLRDAQADEDAKGLVVQKGFEGAKPGQPGRAYFRYDTGRWFEAKVTIVAGTN